MGNSLQPEITSGNLQEELDKLFLPFPNFLNASEPIKVPLTRCKPIVISNFFPYNQAFRYKHQLHKVIKSASRITIEEYTSFCNLVITNLKHCKSLIRFTWKANNSKKIQEHLRMLQHTRKVKFVDIENFYVPTEFNLFRKLRYLQTLKVFMNPLNAKKLSRSIRRYHNTINDLKISYALHLVARKEMAAFNHNIGFLKNVQKLELHLCNGQICETSNFTNLKTLSLKFTNFDSPSAADTVCKTLEKISQHARNLKHIFLEKPDMFTYDVEYCNLFSKINKFRLETFAMDFMQLSKVTSDTFKILAESLDPNHLNSLCLSFFPPSNFNLSKLDPLINKLPDFEHLKYLSFDFHAGHMNQALTLLGKKLKELKSLEEFCVTGIAMVEMRCFNSLCAGLKSLKKLLSLKLEFRSTIKIHHVSEKWLQPISNALKKLPTLRWLEINMAIDVNENQSKSFLMFAQSVATLKDLRTLRLNFNWTGYLLNSLLYLARGLCGCPKLENLSLNYSEDYNDARGLDALAFMLKTLRGIKRIDIELKKDKRFVESLKKFELDTKFKREEKLNTQLYRYP